MRLIDKDALAARLEDECKEWEGESAYQAGLCAAAVIVAEAPTVKQEPTVGGWISVKDRLPVRPPDVCGLPVRRKWYLVALESGAVLTLSYEFDEDRWQGVGSPVTHWMPLPQAPKEVTRDENC